MLKTLTQLESIVDGKVGHFLIDHDATFQNVKEMLFQFGSYIAQLEAQAKAQAEAQAQAAESAKQEQPMEAEAPKE